MKRKIEVEELECSEKLVKKVELFLQRDPRFQLINREQAEKKLHSDPNNHLILRPSSKGGDTLAFSRKNSQSDEIEHGLIDKDDIKNHLSQYCYANAGEHYIHSNLNFYRNLYSSFMNCAGFNEERKRYSKQLSSVNHRTFLLQGHLMEPLGRYFPIELFLLIASALLELSINELIQAGKCLHDKHYELSFDYHAEPHRRKCLTFFSHNTDTQNISTDEESSKNLSDCP
ncbi:hypothetical protein [Legionella sp.]|uniref:hypothetical protein n=1 Tax=Legionella sp. TaxID=459 RepID=UPI00321FB81E